MQKLEQVVVADVEAVAARVLLRLLQFGPAHHRQDRRKAAAKPPLLLPGDVVVVGGVGVGLIEGCMSLFATAYTISKYMPSSSASSSPPRVAEMPLCTYCAAGPLLQKIITIII